MSLRKTCQAKPREHMEMEGTDVHSNQCMCSNIKVYVIEKTVEVGSTDQLASQAGRRS